VVPLLACVRCLGVATSRKPVSLYKTTALASTTLVCVPLEPVLINHRGGFP
jgi:hypothetical protein